MKTNTSRKSVKLLKVACVTCLSASILAACSTQKESPAQQASQQPAGTPAKPLELKVMMIQQAPEPPKKDSPFLKKIEEHTNTKLDITWVPGAGTAYDDKVSATIASGNLPDLILIRKTKESANLNAQLSGVFWELTPYLKDFKNLSQMSPVAVKNASISGKLYGIPRERVLSRYGMIIRKDWLDNLGLQMPKTTDELYKVAKAFTENDPDKDGKKNTFGIQEDATMELLKQLTVYSGGPNAWGLKDGKVIPDFMAPEFKPALDLYKKMVNEKIIAADFPIAKKYDYFNQGKAGIYFSVMDDGYGRHIDMIKQDPKVVVDVTQNFDGPQGQRVRGTTGYDSLIAIPKSSVKDETKLKQILGFIDKMGDEPMLSLINAGLEGADYKLEGATAKKVAGSKGSEDWQNFRWGNQYAGVKIEKTPIEQKIDKSFTDNTKIGVVDLSASLLSDTNTQKGADLKKAITDAQVKFVLGELDDKGWEAAVAKWRSGGGDKIIEEFTADYNKSNGK
ncbi:extracellular solute-binding protein [Paenibacillus alginolyticus]|uniref:Extracellular solute-binding protein n=1 Tax=Paenibacillus alginolyticus TaxID=59839 RepID=A0ABT4GMF4_9BACL|nr:extracellular solute-binding protein [Paenibacillus alginolyticus]MCY9697396.1 extracellular solute-binding protein [Paenibacillus alginolyticus]MEC0146244.1 extracellular solute-binding protein [Paenibacillus alginolyticus]